MIECKFHDSSMILRSLEKRQILFGNGYEWLFAITFLTGFEFSAGLTISFVC